MSIGHLFAFCIVCCAYFLPAMLAHGRNHRNAAAITVLTLFLGWTGLGWIIALIWAFTNDRHPARAHSFSPGQGG